jgi:hypothetical protein
MKAVHDQAVERCADVAEMKVVTYSAPTMPSRTIIDKSSILKVKDELK